MATWHEITRDPEYQELTDQGKALVKRGFFDRVIASDPEYKTFSESAQKAIFDDFWQTPDDTGQGYITSMLGSAGRGFGEMVPGAIEGVGALTGSEGLREFGQDVRGGLESISPVNPVYAETIPAKLFQTVGQVGSVLATAGAGGLAGKALGGVGAATTGMRAAPLASAFLQGSAEGAREAEQYGMTGPEAYLRTLAGGATEAGTELLPFGMAAETTLAKRLLTGAPRTGTFLGAVGSEAGEEGIGQIASNIATKTLAPAGVETPDITAGALEAVAYGAAGGAMLGGVNALISTPPERQTQIQKDLQAEAGAIPKDTVPDQTNEEKMAAMEKGGVTVVSPDGKTAVIAPEPEPSMPDPAEVAKTIGESSVEQLAATGNEASAAAQAEHNRIAAETLGETPEQPVPTEQAAKEAGVEVAPLSEGSVSAETSPNLEAALLSKQERESSGGTTGAWKAVSNDEPPVPNGFVRFYHAGDPVISKGDRRWLSPDRSWVAGFRPGMPVSFVDIPTSDPQLRKSFDDSGTPMSSPFVNFEADEETTAKLKPLSAGLQAAIPQQPVETQEDANRQIPLEESVREEPQDRIESREAEETGAGDQLLSSETGEEEVISSALPSGRHRFSKSKLSKLPKQVVDALMQRKTSLDNSFNFTSSPSIDIDEDSYYTLVNPATGESRRLTTPGEFAGTATGKNVVKPTANIPLPKGAFVVYQKKTPGGGMSLGVVEGSFESPKPAITQPGELTTATEGMVTPGAVASEKETDELRFQRIKGMSPSQRTDEDIAFANAFSKRQKELKPQAGEATRKAFLANHTASIGGRLRKALDQTITFRGLKGTVGSWIENLYNEGWRMALDARGNRQFTNGTEALGSSGLGKVGMNYADFLSSQPQTTKAAAETQTPESVGRGLGGSRGVQSEPSGGSIPEVANVSTETETPSTEKSPATEQQYPTKEEMLTEPSEVTLSIAKRFGGRIAWSQGDLAIIEAFQLFGSKSLYIAVVGDRYSMTDFTLMKPEQRKTLLGNNEELFIRKREEIIEANNRMLAQNPDGPFTDGQTVVVSKNVPQNVASVFREWVRLLGLTAPTRIVLTTPKDGIDMASKYGGKFRRIGVTSLMSDNERGQMTPLGEDDFHIFYKEDTSYARTLEVLAHELGHVLERQAFKNLPEDQRKAIIAEHEKWLKRVGSQKALDGIRELRAMRTGRIHPNFDRADDRFDSLNAYWKSFSEWFADQVARWATTTDKPITVIEKFFARLGKKLREFFNLKGGLFAPNQRVAEWLDSLSPDLNSVVEATLAPVLDKTSPIEKSPVSEAAMSYLMDDLTDAQKAKWTPEMFAAAQAYFDGGGKDFESLQKVVKHPSVVAQAYLKADKAAAAEQDRIEKAGRALDAEILRAEREEKKAEAEMLKREEMRSKAIDSIIGASEKKKRKFGQVTNSDAIAAVAMLVSSKDVPGVLTTWTGTKEDFLRDPANQTADPEIYARIKAGEIVEGFFNKGRAYVFLDGIGVSDQDLLRGKEMGVSAQVAAVRRVLLHESLVHRGIHGLPLRHRRLILNWVRQNSTPAELDDLAKLYTEYANWRNSGYDFEALAEELLAKKVDSLTEIPKDGPMAKLMDILRQIWDFIVGYKREPTLSDLKSVVKLLKSGAEALANDRLKDGGEVKLSYAGEKAIENLPEERRQFMRDSLDAAKAMAAAGKDSEEIRAVTGWFPGKYDGKMRWEVPDDGVSLISTSDGSLDSVLKHEELFSAYPSLSSVKVVFETIKDFGGLWNRDSNTISILNSMSDGDKLNVLLHEVQHAIQDLEGFARGSNPSQFSDYTTQAQKRFDRFRDILDSLGDAVILKYNLRNGAANLGDAKEQFRKEFGREPHPESGQHAKFLTDEEIGREAELAQERLEQAARTIRRGGPSVQYRKTAGEIEARDVQARQKLTPEQRAATAPYSSENIAPEDAIVMFGGGGAQMSMAAPEMDAEYLAAVEAGDMEKAQRMVDEAARGAGFNVGPVYHHGGFDIRENAVPDVTRGFHLGTRQAAEERAFGKPVDDFIAEAEIAFDEDLGAWFWSSQGTDSYDVIDEEGFSSEEIARRSLEEFASQEDFSGSEIEDLGNLTAAYLRINNPLVTADQKADWNDTIKRALAGGYDSVQYRNDFEDKGSTSYIALQEGQIKSADPVTRDDAGNVIPLSQRFQTTLPDIRFSRPQFSSETSAALTAGSEAARSTLYSERDMDIREAIRRAYEAMPKTNSVAVPIGELFAKTEELMPGVTQDEFSNVLQDLFEDNGAVLQEGESDFFVTTPEGRRAGFVVVMPRAAKASRIPIEDAEQASKSFKADLIQAGKGRLDTEKYQGFPLKGTEPPEHPVKAYELYRDGAIKLIDDLLAKTNDIVAVADSLQDPEFQVALGLQVGPEVSSDMITIARQLIGIELQNRLRIAAKGESDPVRKRQIELAEKGASAYYSASTGAGQSLQNIQQIQDDPRYKSFFLFEQAGKKKAEAAKEKLDAITGGTEAITDMIQGVEKDAATEASQTTADEMESSAEDDQDAIDLAAGEATLTGKFKALYEELKDLIREEGIIAGLMKKAGNLAKASISAERRNDLSSMTKEGLQKRSERNKKRIGEILEALLGKESDAKTPEQQKTRQKRKKGIETLEKRAKKGKSLDISDSESLFKTVISEMGKARPGKAIPLKKQMPWREILSQKADTAEMYRQRIFDAIMQSEAFKELEESDKALIADIFAKQWQARRDAILDRMLEREIDRKMQQDSISKEVAKQLQKARNKILEIINLGGFNNDDLVKILGERYGISTEFTEEQKARIQELSEQLQNEDLNPAKRNKLAMEFAVTLAGASEIPVAEIIANWWTSSVLFGPQTIFSIGAAFLNGAYNILTIGTTRTLAKLGKLDIQGAIEESIAMLQGISRYIGAFKQAGRRAWNYLWSGDIDFLGFSANDILGEIKSFDDLQKFKRHKLIAENLAKDPRAMRRYVGIYLRFVNRLLTALDAFNVMVTKAGMTSIALRQSGMTTDAIIKAEKMMDLKPYREQVIRDYFDNKAPKTPREKGLVDSYAEAEMYRALDKMGAKMENADYSASESAFTMTPTGAGGFIFRKITGIDQAMRKSADEFLEKSKKEWLTEQDMLAFKNLALAYIRHFLAYQAANVAGCKFIRFASNKFNQGISYLPIIGLLRKYEESSDAIKGKEAFIDSIHRNQAVGYVLVFIGLQVIKAIEEEPDDEKRGFFWNGGWGNLTPDQKKQNLAKGQKEYTFGFNYNGRQYTFNYQNWPMNQVLAAIGSMSDLIRFSPKEWNGKNALSKVSSGVVSGASAALDIPALSQLGELFGNRIASKDPTEQTIDRFSRIASGWAGGFVPRILKDIDFATQPELRKYKTLWEKTASHIPIYRRYVGEDYYDILGQPIKRNVIPGSREFMMGPTEPEYKILGALNSRNIFLTPANAEYRMVGKGRNRRRLTQEEADAYSLETGKGYRQMLLRYGQRALQMPTERARAFLSDKADEVRDRALKKVYRGYLR